LDPDSRDRQTPGGDLIFVICRDLTSFGKAEATFRPVTSPDARRGYALPEKSHSFCETGREAL